MYGVYDEIRGNIVENEYDLSFSEDSTFSDHLKFKKSFRGSFWRKENC